MRPCWWSGGAIRQRPGGGCDEAAAAAWFVRSPHRARWSTCGATGATGTQAITTEAPLTGAWPRETRIERAQWSAATHSADRQGMAFLPPEIPASYRRLREASVTAGIRRGALAAWTLRAAAVAGFCAVGGLVPCGAAARAQTQDGRFHRRLRGDARWLGRQHRGDREGGGCGPGARRADPGSRRNLSSSKPRARRRSAVGRGPGLGSPGARPERCHHLSAWFRRRAAERDPEGCHVATRRAELRASSSTARPASISNS